MDVILLDKIANLGELGDQVSVKAGYGRNYLLPQGKAVIANKENVAVFEQRRAEYEAKVNAELAEAHKRAEALSALEGITIATKVGDEGKLFGSIGTRDIADAVSAAGQELHKSEVRLPDGPIRLAGEHTVDVQLHSDVHGKVVVTIVSEK